ncbi:carbohydrate-binding protein [Bacillus sp. JJ722]|uniref:carbohydrate-binding protein n=1 Tax=Bacillus sp. JJ722 TaxID=3122973 RepID=UPI002FFE404D
MFNYNPYDYMFRSFSPYMMQHYHIDPNPFPYYNRYQGFDTAYPDCLFNMNPSFGYPIYPDNRVFTPYDGVRPVYFDAYYQVDPTTEYGEDDIHEGGFYYNLDDDERYLHIEDVEARAQWSEWENLGSPRDRGIKDAPAVASRGPNRLDTFVQDPNNRLWHKWWNGRRWSDWNAIEGQISSSPAAVSWGGNRIDLFARGMRGSLWHRYTEGNRWSQWEDLEGEITSAPAASSRGPFQLDVFARGTNGSMWTRSWNGRRWSEWQDLGGQITSGPAAASWAPNRMDVFARGTDNNMWHKWWS